jgi:cyclase
MTKVRVISRLDIKGPNLVKGIHLEGLRVLGNPQQFALNYYHEGADEIFYMDCVASLYGRNSLNDFISLTAKETFIPLTVGGGLRTIEDIRNALRSGADKVSINTAAIKDPTYIGQAARLFGSSTIVATIEAIKQQDGRYLAFVDNGRDHTGKEVVQWAKTLEEMGAGEIVITSVDREGTSQGFDTELILSVVSSVKIPVIAHGGASTVENVCEMIRKTKISGVCIASAFHYDQLKNEKVSRSGGSAFEGNTSFLQSGRAYDKIKTFSIADLKKEMLKQSIPCRAVYT